MNPSSSTVFHLPPGYARVRVVASFEELVGARFSDGVNALCWPRTLTGDFDEVVARVVAGGDEIESLDEATLQSLTLGAGGRAAVATLLADYERLRAHGLSPVLDCIHRYPRDAADALVPTDVYSYHADSATVEADTFLCSYAGAASEGLRNEDALRYVDQPVTRAALLREYGGADDDGFRDFLEEHCYDLHYLAIPPAQPFSFGLGNFWRIAIQYPGCPVPPCVHRAPATLPGQPPRLLLIS
jgi:hypothetical protein